MGNNFVALIAVFIAVQANAENAVQSACAFGVRVELSKNALEKLGRVESIVVVATFADEIGPGGDNYGGAQYEVFKPRFVTVGQIGVPSMIDQKVQQIDFEVNVNVVPGRRKYRNNILSCGFIQGKLSELIGQTKIVQCDLI